ncbi:outer membrane beta-barrel protein [Chitinophaga sp. Cy-1792]|uniref:outer membrane beta-barrel protein n=1 Tax=Chitinophaga sp. Cy-1792 TaxID=2608339 RepID=UPI00141E6D0D|nr:outer membrane beta-barrel protein [Chitinophaga sp. Cy-1792]
MVPKQIIPVFMLAVALYTAKSQAQEKKNYISGTVGFSSYTQDNRGTEFKANTFTIMPSYGHYISEKFSIGIAAGYSHISMKQTGIENPNKTNGFNVGPFIRFEQPIWGDKVSVYNDLGLSYENTKGESSAMDNNDRDVSSNAGTLYYKPGLIVNFTKRTSLLLNLGYLLNATHSEKKDPSNGTVKQTSAGIQSGFGLSSLNFGFQFKF